jgi:hypothetical protein
VVDPHVQRVGVERLWARRVPDDDVGVRARAQAALAGEDAEQAGRGLGAQADPVLGGDPAGPHALPHQREPGLDAGQAAGDLGEVGEALGPAREPPVPVGHGERAVVGRHRVHPAPRQALPQLLAVLGVAQGRRAHEVLAARAIEDRGVEVQVLRAGLGGEAHAPLLRGPDLGQRRSGRQVDHVRRGAGDLGEAADTVDGLGLERRGAGLAVGHDRRAALVQRPPAQGLDGAAVLAVDGDQAAVAAARPQHVEHDVVVHLQQLRVRQVELEAGHAPLDAVGHHSLADRLGERHVEPVVDHGR